MTPKPDNTALDPQQVIAELQRQLDEYRAELTARNSAYSERITYQAAANDVLKVMSASPGDPQPVFDLISVRARDICDAYGVTVYEFDGSLLHFRAATGVSENPAVRKASKAAYPTPPTRHLLPGRAILDRAIVHIRDHDADAELHRISLTVKSSVVVPLMRGNLPIGALHMGSRKRGGFSDTQVELLKTFAEQAVIAITSAETYRELQQRTGDLTESLQQQTATTDILATINASTGNLGSVFDMILTKAHALCGVNFGSLQLYDGERIWAVAVHGLAEEFAQILRQGFPATKSPWFQAALEGHRHFQILDAAKSDSAVMRTAAELAGIGTTLFVPMRKENRLLGAIVGGRLEVRPFSGKEIDLLENFAGQAALAIENARLFNETKEALEQQTATTEVLQVINASPGNLGPVFDAILEKSMRLCDAAFGSLYTFDGQDFQTAAQRGLPAAWAAYRAKNPPSGRAEGPFIQLLETKRPVHITDIKAEEVYRNGTAAAHALVDLGGGRTVLYVPLLKDHAVLGTIVTYRQEVRPFTDKQIALLENFAAQAVIATENARLVGDLRQRTNDLEESLQQQTATSEALQVISSSQGDLGPVFHKMLENATRVCGAGFGAMNLVEGETMRRAALYNAPPEFAAALVDKTMRIHPQSSIVAAISSKRVVQVEDMRQSPAYLARAQHAVELTELGGARTIVVVPMLRDDEAIGVITVYRQEVRPFSEKQVELLTNFARQAVIAIENSRLITETREALEQQTATADVLKVIGRSAFDLDQVFETVVESSVRLCAADRAIILRFDGEMLRVAKVFNAPQALREWLEENPIRPGRHSVAARAALERRTIQVQDVQTDPEHTYGAKFVEPFRTVLGVPMLKGDDLLGVILVYHNVVRPFTDKQILLVSTFGEQAAIAIENVRLFDEVQARTRDLQESLQQQTATSEVLKVISSSPGELKPVFNSMLENAVSICDAKFGNLFLVDGDTARWEAGVGTPPKLAEFFTQSTWFRPTPGSHLARVLRTKEVSHTADDTGEAVIGVSARLGGARSTVCVPMVKDDTLVGAIFIYRTEVRPFTDKQIDLVRNFAAQAVIAIENARLLKELRQRTDDLSASLDDLRTAQDRLVQTEKLASLGQLTAGIAHEIKNPLNFVNNFAALSVELTDELNDVLKQAAIADKLRAEADELTGLLKDNLAKVVQHGKRADSIVKNMLLHSREGSGEHRPADINALVDESLNLAYHGARAEKSGFNITLQREFDATAGSAELFPQEITRALLNLISNGFYAATKRKTENGEANFEPTLSASTKNLGASVEIRIRDNGIGISPEVKEKMFNPFFTTKPAGEGTGLGLSMTHDIVVKQHGGTIRVDTKPGEFTEFIITLPRATGVQDIQRSTR